MFELFRQTRVHVLDDQRSRGHEARRVCWAKSLRQKLVCFVSETVGRATHAADVESDRLRRSLVDDTTQCGRDVSPGRIQDFEEMLQVLFRITDDGDAIEFVAA